VFAWYEAMSFLISLELFPAIAHNSFARICLTIELTKSRMERRTEANLNLKSPWLKSLRHQQSRDVLMKLASHFTSFSHRNFILFLQAQQLPSHVTEV
jgi:hypothetical protein